MIVWCHQWHGLLQALKPRFWTAKSYVTSQFLIRVTTFLLLAMTIGKCGFVFNKLPPDPMVYHYFPCSRTCHDLGVCPIVRQSKYHIKLIIWYVYIYTQYLYSFHFPILWHAIFSRLCWGETDGSQSEVLWVCSTASGASGASPRDEGGLGEIPTRWGDPQ